jgi:hypothetical protein
MNKDKKSSMSMKIPIITTTIIVLAMYNYNTICTYPPIIT